MTKRQETYTNGNWSEEVYELYREYYGTETPEATVEEADEHIQGIIDRGWDEEGDHEHLGYFLLDAIGGPSELDKETLEQYFDYSAFGRDCVLGGDYTLIDDGNGNNIVVCNN